MNQVSTTPEGAAKLQGLKEVAGIPVLSVEPSEVDKALATGVSKFGEGNQVVDAGARARLEATHAKLWAAGVAVDAGNQLYATGTRMAQVGYENQARRAQEHATTGQPISEACEALSRRVRDERREDVVVGAGELARSIEVNGSLKAAGYKLSEQAIRGLCARLESPAIRYLLGLRGRIMTLSAERNKVTQAGVRADEAGRATLRESYKALCAAIAADKAHLAETVRRELLANPAIGLKLRTRGALGDCFAVVSPGFTPADAPEVIAQVGEHLPAYARGTWSYDPETTSWELRADVWTPNPVHLQAVGEPFRASTTFFGKDNGTGRFGGGGTVEMLACLNAGTYVANAASVSRVHRANVMVDLDEVLKEATAAIEVMCEAWGGARRAVVEVPKKITIEDAIPGFWRYLLTDRRSELAAVLPGRSEKHVAGLTKAFASERRDRDNLVRADFAQGWTKYIQEQPAGARREAERAVGEWLVGGRPVRCLVDEVDG